MDAEVVEDGRVYFAENSYLFAVYENACGSARDEAVVVAVFNSIINVGAAECVFDDLSDFGEGGVGVCGDCC